MNNNIKRTLEIDRLKSEINVMLKALGLSKRAFKKSLPKMKGSGYKYFIVEKGKKASIRQQYLLLKQVVEYKNKKDDGEEAVLPLEFKGE